MFRHRRPTDSSPVPDDIRTRCSPRTNSSADRCADGLDDAVTNDNTAEIKSTTGRDNDHAARTSVPECWRGRALSTPNGYVFDDAVRPWNWSELGPDDAERLWGFLIGFVVYFNARYGARPDHRIVPCWFEHGPIVEELTTLALSRWRAFESPLASIVGAQQWHASAVPAFFDRMRTWLSDDLLACQLGRHRVGSRDIGPNDDWDVRVEIVAILDVERRRDRR